MKPIIANGVFILYLITVLHTCSASTNLTIGYTILPPLLVGEFNSTLLGAGGEILNDLINKCLGADVTFEHTHYANSEVLHLSFPSNTFTLPVARTTLMNGMLTESNKYSFIQLIETAGPVLLISNTARRGKVVASVAGSWPLLAVVMTSASLSGIVIWILDRHANPKDFPKTVIRGTWEGFWWALITMTTVGYGDKTPSSIQARVFSIFWILIGIVMVSIFTATLAASFTADEAALEDIRGLNVGVMEGSEEFIATLGAGATPIEYNNVTELLSELEIGIEMDAAMFDSLHIIFLTEELQKYDIDIVASFDRPCSYGVITNNLSTIEERCMYKMAYKSRYTIMRKIKTMMTKHEKQLAYNHGESTVKRILSPNLVSIYALLGVFLLLAIVFFVWEQIYRCKKKIRSGKKIFKVTVNKNTDAEVEKQEMQEQHTNSNNKEVESVKIDIDQDMNDKELTSTTEPSEKDNIEESHNMNSNDEKEVSGNNSQDHGTQNGQVKFTSN